MSILIKYLTATLAALTLGSACTKSKTAVKDEPSEEFAGGAPSTVVTGANLNKLDTVCEYSNDPVASTQEVECAMILPKDEESHSAKEETETDLQLPEGYVFATALGDDVAANWEIDNIDSFDCEGLTEKLLSCLRTSDTPLTSIQVSLTVEDLVEPSRSITKSRPATYVGPLSAPSAPTNLTATYQAGPQISLSWVDTSSDELDFKLQRSTDNFSFSLLISLPATTSSYIDTTVSDGQVYYYRVQACSNQGCSSFATSGSVISPGGYQLVFVTSTTYNGNLGLVTGADAKCQARANVASLGGTWKAIISGVGMSAASRLTISGEIRDLNGQKIADNAADLWDGTLDTTINRNELNIDDPKNVWTGSESNGSTSTDHCNEWQSSDLSDYGRIGTPIDISPWITDTIAACDSSQGLYCINGQ